MGDINLWDTASGSKVRALSTSPMASLTQPGGLGSMGNVSTMKPGLIKPGSMPNLQNMPSIADITSMMTNMMGAMSAGTMGRTVTSLAFSPDGHILATGGVETKSNFDAAAMMGGAQGQKGQKKNSKAPPQDPQDFLKNMKVETTGQVVLWDVASGGELGALKGHGKGVTQVAFSRDGALARFEQH